MAALLSTGVETLENLRHRLGPDMAGIIPHTMEDLRRQVNSMLHEHAQKISAVGVAGLENIHASVVKGYGYWKV